MAGFVTRRDLDRMRHHVRRSRDEAAKTEYMTGQLTQTAEVLAGAGAVGFLGGYKGRVAVLGVDVDLLAGLGLLAFAYWGGGAVGDGKPKTWAPHVHNVSDGVLAGYVIKKFAQWGNSMAASAGKPVALPAAGTAALPGQASALIGAQYGHGYVSQQEIAQMAAQAFQRAA